MGGPISHLPSRSCATSRPVSREKSFIVCGKQGASRRKKKRKKQRHKKISKYEQTMEKREIFDGMKAIIKWRSCTRWSKQMMYKIGNLNPDQKGK